MLQNRERWIITVELPAGKSGRFMARVLKHLGRVWGVRCRALAVDNEVRRLQTLLEEMAQRLAAQSDLLAQAAQKKEPPCPSPNSSHIPKAHAF
jgi:hypothetical protein